ncbi:hypothetical protein SDC9_207151 [bioreactor metagenome]|uniref:Uncharacterized protein n=1 Tax=bioreactor metagenome TaxID=1076179 RepID=A0A645J8F9_9ZZZZ
MAGSGERDGKKYTAPGITRFGRGGFVAVAGVAVAVPSEHGFAALR